jgi:hypothetical protein
VGVPSSHLLVDMVAVADVFAPRVGPFSLINLEKFYALDSDESILDQRGVSLTAATVFVSPDDCVARIVSRSGSTNQLSKLFSLLPKTHWLISGVRSERTGDWPATPFGQGSRVRLVSDEVLCRPLAHDGRIDYDIEQKGTISMPIPAFHHVKIL